MAELRRMRPLLGTYVEVGARGAEADLVIEAAFKKIEFAQNCWSFQSSTSELTRLNSQPLQRVSLNRKTLQLLRLAKTMAKLSNGIFDCTVGGLLINKGVLPDHGNAAFLPRGNVDDIEIGDAWARLRRPVRLTLDGIAKGFAVDLAVNAMRKSGAHAGWVNAGGDVRVFGDMTLTMQRREFDGTLASLGSLRHAALATSRVSLPNEAPCPDFPAYMVARDERVAPATGVWTVLARTAWRADALTKVAANVSTAERANLILQLGGCLIHSTALKQVA